VDANLLRLKAADLEVDDRATVEIADLGPASRARAARPSETMRHV